MLANMTLHRNIKHNCMLPLGDEVPGDFFHHHHRRQ